MKSLVDRVKRGETTEADADVVEQMGKTSIERFDTINRLGDRLEHAEQRLRNCIVALILVSATLVGTIIHQFLPK